MHTDTIIRQLTQMGASVQPLDLLGGRGGAQLLLVGYLGFNWLLVVTDPARSKALTPTEEQWVKQWKGMVGLIEEPSQLTGTFRLPF